MPDRRFTSAFAVDRHRTDATPAPRSVALTSGSTAATAAALTATLGLAAAAWVVAVMQMNGMDMGVATELGSFGLCCVGSSIVGTDWETYRREGPGVSAFALEDGVVYHTYSAYARGLDGLWGMYQWLDRAPLGRNETGHWWRRHDEYDGT
ncbi:MAG: DUF899 family protein [Streptosporangiaceae bacterium]